MVQFINQDADGSPGAAGAPAFPLGGQGGAGSPGGRGGDGVAIKIELEEIDGSMVLMTQGGNGGPGGVGGSGGNDGAGDSDGGDAEDITVVIERTNGQPLTIQAQIIPGEGGSRARGWVRPDQGRRRAARPDGTDRHGHDQDRRLSGPAAARDGCGVGAE